MGRGYDSHAAGGKLPHRFLTHADGVWLGHTISVGTADNHNIQVRGFFKEPGGKPCVGRNDNMRNPPLSRLLQREANHGLGIFLARLAENDHILSPLLTDLGTIRFHYAIFRYCTQRQRRPSWAQAHDKNSPGLSGSPGLFKGDELILPGCLRFP
ncbi:hypothetical protein SDC9_142804 [bioreactor metagenome]|uniref:Uncharacterized protein n=1 Tax=bioreactor metagenome TaxID=1076179 RepID=A0A645E274_9ZZZZ